ncbi:MAG: peptidylprolyl isomerase [Acidobacteriota bacterium]|nr:peptidylprolyl isomerase [Acidobacteriota bacterium]
MKKLLREPLVHFLAVGVVLFVVAGLTRDPGSGRQARILVTDDDIARLSVAWQRQWRRPPSVDELANLVRSHLREEILYREAVALGLDQDDTIVRRRLVQKMEFLSEDMAVQTDPPDDAIADYFNANIEDFRVPPRVGFTHAYFSRDRRGEATDKDTRALVERLSGNVDPAAADDEGDRFMLQRSYAAKSEVEIGQLFGRAFATSIHGLEVGRWHGPIESGYGLHAVFVHSREESRLPALDDVRDEVRNELLTTRRREANRDLYERLRDKYVIEVEDSELAGQLPAQVLEALDEI